MKKNATIKFLGTRVLKNKGKRVLQIYLKYIAFTNEYGVVDCIFGPVR